MTQRTPKGRVAGVNPLHGDDSWLAADQMPELINYHTRGRENEALWSRNETFAELFQELAPAMFRELEPVVSISDGGDSPTGLLCRA